jgi:hypothetical protein
VALLDRNLVQVGLAARGSTYGAGGEGVDRLGTDQPLDAATSTA